MPTLGLEMEMVVADRATGRSHAVGPYFDTLAAIKTRRGEPAELLRAGAHPGAVAVAVASPGIFSSLDNGFNNLESSIGPVPDGPANLLALDRAVRRELDAVCAALAEEGATILDLAEHPDLGGDGGTYARIRAPKPIYDYWINRRGWNHAAGIDAKAQNSPSTGVAVEDAVRALNTLLALSPALIALHANSPFEAGRVTGIKENRLTLWPRMFTGATFAGDRRLHVPPAVPFADLRDYFAWMFGPGTVMQCVPLTRQQAYKTLGELYHIDGDPCLLEFLASPRWSGRCIVSGESAGVVPALHHLEFLQFTSFLDARIRFRFAEGSFTGDPGAIAGFLAAWERPGGLEALFAERLECCYIEGRAAGALFPDAELAALPDARVAESAVLSPAALQTGLLRNLDAAARLADTVPWPALPVLRAAAIRDGLRGAAGGVSLETLCRRVVAVAADGLDAAEQRFLAHAEHVLRTRRTGADRALDAYERLSGPQAGRALAVARQRAIVWPLDEVAEVAADRRLDATAAP